MKLNLSRRPDGNAKPILDAVPDSECAIVIAKPSEQRLKIGFEVSPIQSPTTKANPHPTPFTKTDEPRDKSPFEKSEPEPGSSKSLGLVPKQENASFCDRILQSLAAAGMGSKKTSDNELQVPSPTTTSAGGSPIAPRVNRCSPFSFRELGQELKSVMKTSSQAKLALHSPASDGTPSEVFDSNDKESRSVSLVMRRVPNGRFSESVTLKSSSQLISCTMENNRQSHIFPQSQIPLQRLYQQQHQHHSPLQPQQHHPPHRQISSDPYRPTIIKHHNSSPGGFLQHDQTQQQHHYHQQQQLNTLPQQQQNNHQNHDPQQQQQQQQQYFKRSLENIPQQHYADDSHQLHCQDYSESSSSESSTEEDGWDSGTVVSSNTRRHHVTTPTSTISSNFAGNTRNGNGVTGWNIVASPSCPFNHLQLRNHTHHSIAYDDDDQPNEDVDDDEDAAAPGATRTTSQAMCSPSGSRSSVTSAPEPPVKPSSTKSPIKKSASAVEAAVSTAANKLRRMSANAKFSFSNNNSSNTNCKSNNKSSTSSAVSGSSINNCDILNVLTHGPISQQASLNAAVQQKKYNNASSPITSPNKVVGRSISNDPTASTSSGATSTIADHLRRDSLPIIGGLLSSFSSSSVSSSNSSSLSTSTFGTGSNHQGLPLLGSTVGQQKPSKLQALFSVSSCYNGSHGRNDGGKINNGRRVSRTICYGDEEDDDGNVGGGGGGDGDDDDDNRDDDDVVAAAVAKVTLGSNGTPRRNVPRKLGSTASNSDSGRSSTEIGPEAEKEPQRQRQDGAASNGCLNDVV
uniref:Putative thyroid hormone receptor-associated protein complex subunit n=1 Tax=Aedes aegypti TaxID=7159 RepID=A0A0P6IYR1_AEDAE